MAAAEMIHPQRDDLYVASNIKRTRGTKNEMGVRRNMLVDLAETHGPCSVRHLFYRAVVEKMPGVTKSASGYNKVQRLALELRRSGAIDYSLIVDGTRWMRIPTMWDSAEDALAQTAELYRKNYWTNTKWRLEVWCESDSIAGTITAKTGEHGVPCFPTKGYTSETFAWSASQAWLQTPHRQPVVIYVGDHDPHGIEIEAHLKERLAGFTGMDVPWHRVGVTRDQIEELDLPTSGTLKKPYKDELAGYRKAVEAEALPPRMLVDLVDEAIAEYEDDDALRAHRTAEKSERAFMYAIARKQPPDDDVDEVE